MKPSFKEYQKRIGIGLGPTPNRIRERNRKLDINLLGDVHLYKCCAK